MADTQAGGILVDRAIGSCLLGLDPTWETVERPHDAILLISVEPPREDGEFRANHVVSIHSFEMAVTLRDWQISSDFQLDQHLSGYLLVDLEHAEVGGHPGIRRLATYESDEGRSLTMVQWCALVEGRGYELTSTVSTLAYPRLAENLEAVANTWRIHPEGQPDGE